MEMKKVDESMFDSIRDYRNEMLSSRSSFDGCNRLEEYEDIEKWYLFNRLFESYETCPPGYSLGYMYAYLNDDEVIGMVNIRPDASNHPHLKRYGGHIGYSVKPSYRGKGIGSIMLRDTLDICRDEFKLDKVLVTCLKSNEASRRVILNNNGEYESDVFYEPENEELERYWISL